jgi:[protein-PII] uridylyltransferase
MHDTLEYALQQPVAEGLGYGRSGELRSVEVFMSDYYRHARTVHRTSRRLLQKFRELIEPMPDGGTAGERLPPPLLLYQGNLSVGPSVRSFDNPVAILDAFAVAAETGLEMDFRLRGAIERSADRLPGRDPEWEALAERFRRIIRSNHVAQTLYAMNDLGVLGRMMPEFGDLVAFFQHNVYHYYTADEHTLIAVAHAEALANGTGTLHDAFCSLPRRDTLFMAVLLHDIAKPRGVADHEITGVTMARTVLRRLGMDDISSDIEFLVRHHLVMEQTAFRRNIHDPETIKEFAARFVRPGLLDYLYVLTYADLSALNASVWTEWKAAMLRDLYQQTAEVLRQRLTAEEIDRFHLDRRAATVNRLIADIRDEVPEADTAQHLQGMNNDTYLAVFTTEEIADHIRLARDVNGVVTRFRHAGGSTEVSVIAPDAPFALSRFCAVLSANDANIFDANIFTRADGVIIDRFRVSATGTGGPLDERTCGKVSLDLTRVMRGELDVEQLFREHHRKWRRRPRTSRNPTIRTDVVFEDNPRYTILDVYAPDSVGFLYRVTETISNLGLDIYFAKIATRVDGIIDAFYVLDRTGSPVRDDTRRTEIRSRILHTIRSIRELTPE